MCIASYNGERYIADQLNSILACTIINEVIVSDDGSTDATCQIVRGINDARIRLINGPCLGVVKNFESALREATGDIIFLSDQDDIWMPNKVEHVVSLLDKVDLVVTDCKIVDDDLCELHPSFFKFNNSAPGLLRNLAKNGYLGCCMAMRRGVVERCIPFPAKLPMHDWWIGLIAEMSGRVMFLHEGLSLYRRHGSNVSTAGAKSKVPIFKRLTWRLYLAYHLCVRLLFTSRESK